ncbi:MAG TPA: potassium channel family protein [Terriglobales bacterium]
MKTVAILAGLAIIVSVLLDAFETVVLPRRVSRHFRLTAWFYRRTWIPWSRLARRIQSPARREAFFGYFGPLSLIFLLGFWAAGLIFGFALLQQGAGGHVRLGSEPVRFGTLLYHSGETFFTLGYGDIVPESGAARVLAVLEAGTGFAFLAAVIGYLPTIYSAFSRREIEISLLDARAGSPPSAAELLCRLGKSRDQAVLDQLFRDWERWAAEVLESHLSYPVLSFFRSQHNNQSWLGALTTILDASSIVVAGMDGIHNDQARLTFAMARHAMVDLAQVVNARYQPKFPDRLPPEQLKALRQTLSATDLRMRDAPEAEEKLKYLRSLYEPYAQAIARNLFITLPAWVPPERKKDNWQSGPWDRLIQAKGLGELQRADEHF